MPRLQWWILCAASLSCFLLRGSARRTRAAGEPRIFNELCAMRDDPGPCKAIKERYFFNVDTGSCELFEYGGCGGNDNNFETMEACVETCVFSADKNPCHLAEAPGPCRGLVTRYMFDSHTQQCRSFFYGGCFGNANNFRSMAECRAKCQNPVAEPTKPSHFARNVVRPPTANEEPALSEPQVQTNDTGHASKELRPAGPCFSPIDPGTCDGVEKRFAFNVNTRKCQMFHYSGCGGNDNNFQQRRECMVKCVKKRRGHGRRMIRIKKKNLNNIAQRHA